MKNKFLLAFVLLLLLLNYQVSAQEKDEKKIVYERIGTHPNDPLSNNLVPDKKRLLKLLKRFGCHFMETKYIMKSHL